CTVRRRSLFEQNLRALLENIDGELSLCGLTEFPRQDARQYCSCPGPVLFGAGDELAQAGHFPRKHRRQYDRMRFRDCLIQRATMKWRRVTAFVQKGGKFQEIEGRNGRIRRRSYQE